LGGFLGINVANYGIACKFMGLMRGAIDRLNPRKLFGLRL